MRLPQLALLAAVLGFVGCAKQSTESAGTAEKAAAKTDGVALVAANSRSPNFAAVQKHLELGGTVYGYMDVDGDVAMLGKKLNESMATIAQAQPMMGAFVQQDFSAILDKLGFAGVKAIGVSSVPDPAGYYRNTTFLYTPEPRKGLLLGLGGAPGPFKHFRLAPADADLFVENEIDLAAVYSTIKDVVSQVGGQTTTNQLEAGLKAAGDQIGLALLDMIYRLKGHAAFVLRVDPARTMNLPTNEALVVPAFDALLVVEGIGPLIEDPLRKDTSLKQSENGLVHYYTPRDMPASPGFQPVLAVEGPNFYVATSRDFLDARITQSAGIDQDPKFMAALKSIGENGNGLTYVSPRLAARLREIPNLNPQMGAPNRQLLDLILGQMPAGDKPLISVRTNEPDGILVRSHWNTSLKADLAAVSIYPLSLAMIPTLGIAAMQRGSPSPAPPPAPSRGAAPRGGNRGTIQRGAPAPRGN